MLTVIYGTSCVGKTTIMNEMKNSYGWIPLFLFTTRKLRKNDINRIFIEENQLKKGRASGEIRIMERCFGNTYGVPLKEVIKAVNDRTCKYLIDCPIEYRELFEEFNHCKIILMAERKEQLTRNIKRANREMRLNEIMKIYEELYIEQDYPGYIKQINYENDIEKTITDINEQYEKWLQCEPI